MLEPISQREWRRITAAHLLNRTGFGATPNQIEAAVKRSPQDVVNEIVDFERTPDPFEPPSWMDSEADLRPERQELRRLPEEERRRRLEEFRRMEEQRFAELRAWWLYRMRYTKRPLQEKLTLFWHGHFATSMEKVRSSYAMYRQNETFRQHAAGNWRTLLVAVAQDPAMLIYLDNAQSNARHPNENFAREFIELFTLGEGHYREDDVKEAARAFTGWTLHPDRYAFVSLRSRHDAGSKKFLGRRGVFDGHDIVDIVLEQPAAAPFISRKLWTFFAYDNPEPALVRELGLTLRNSRFEFKPLLKTIFLSREFYSDRAIRTQIKSPTQWLVGGTTSLDAPLPSAEQCARMLRLLGQNLFEPPSVKGWEGGYAWITAATLMHRYKLTAELMTLVDVPKALPQDFRASPEEARKHLELRVFQSQLRREDAASIGELFQRLPEPARWSDADVRNIIRVMMSTPLYQLC